MDDLLGSIRPVLPILSYLVNIITKLFDTVTSFLGFDVRLPSLDETTTGAEESTTVEGTV